MKPEDFVYKQTLKACLSCGINNSIATAAATRAVELYAKWKNLKGGVSKMIADVVADAKLLKNNHG